jgi:iron complex transport system ATP-binding protein
LVTLKICGIECFYGSTKVLDKIVFTAKAGEFIGILGPNGSGKTTLIKSLSRALKPKIGTIYLDNLDVYGMDAMDMAKKVAVVPQDTPMTFDYKALDVVLMGRHPHIGLFEAENKEDVAITKKSMELTKVWHLADRRINELSGGEKQRIVIARALAQEPRVLLLDEPTSHLDINYQLDIMDLVRELCKKNGLVILAVFHDFNLAARYCDSIILLKEGRVFSIGSLDTVLTAKNILEVFQVNTVVKKHPITDYLYIVPLSCFNNNASLQKTFKVHVIGGMGTGTMLMKSLLENGYKVTAGVLTVLDTDYETACTLGISVVSDAPFSSITEEAYKANLAKMEHASAIVISNTPFGYGNLKNLAAAKTALEQGKPVIIIQETPIKGKDFADGKAEALFKELVSKGAKTVTSNRDVLPILRSLEQK